MFKDHLRFIDTNRGHMIVGEITHEDEHGFIFVSRGYKVGVWEFKLLIIECFKEKFYKNVSGGRVVAEKINTTDDLYYWFRREFKM